MEGGLHASRKGAAFASLFDRISTGHVQFVWRKTQVTSVPHVMGFHAEQHVLLGNLLDVPVIVLRVATGPKVQ